MKYLRSTTFGCNDIRIRKSEFVANTQFTDILRDLPQVLIFQVLSNLMLQTFEYLRLFVLIYSLKYTNIKGLRNQVAKMNGLGALIGPLPSFLQGYSVATISKYNLPSCKSGQHILKKEEKNSNLKM